VPNIFDFNTPAPGRDAYNDDLRSELGIPADATIILQPTRIIPRKGIELAIRLVAKVGEGEGEGEGVVWVGDEECLGMLTRCCC
jgi:hypothetical protein